MEIGSDEWAAIIRKGAVDLGIAVGDDAMQGFITHALEMVRFSRKINLTTITDPVEIATKHVIDSLAAAPYVGGARTLLDIGSGAGFPGIPLKLAHPVLEVTLIDGSARKVSFLKHIIRHLHVDGMAADHIRAEQLARNRHARYDVVITRALGSLEKCMQLALPLVNEEKGIVIALRGPTAGDALISLRRLIIGRLNHQMSKAKSVDLKAHHFLLPLTNHRRSIIILRVY